VGKLIQLQFLFPSLSNFEEENFIVSSSNQDAWDLIQAWPTWTKGQFPHIAMIYGTNNCGKTHLSHIFAAHSQAIFINESDIVTKTPLDFLADANCFILENIEKLLPFYQEKLLHIINYIQEQNKYLLITALYKSNLLTVSLADLRSRLNVITSAEICPPDDDLLKALLAKYFSDRHLIADVNIIEYLVKRIERSFTAAKNIVEIVDHTSVATKSNINIKLLRNILREI
jgi:chromosomal replication initiation ATPase DnaA